MKRIFLLLLPILAVLSSCTELKEMRQDIDELDGRVSKLEELCKEMNTNISSLQTIVTALQEKDYVTKVTPVDKAGKVIGYTINFTKSDQITIYHGEKGDKGDTGHSPKVGVKKDTDGIYYWTLDDEWLLNQDGKKVKAEGIDGKDGTNGKDGQDGLTPELKIQEGYWYVRYGNEEWRKLGPATGQDGKPGTDGTNGKDGQDGDSFFKDVKVTADNVVFTLSNGETFNLPFFKGTKLSITFDDSEIGILPGKTASVAYTVQGGSDKTVVKALGQNGWSAKVVKESSTNGKIIVTSPDPLIEDEIIVLVNDGERTIMSTINFVTGVITPSAEAINAAIEGGQYEITINTNLNYTVEIPQSDKNWISLVPQTKSMRTDKLTFSISPNDGTMRKSVVSLNDEKGNTLQEINVFQDGSIATDPTSNQIYYSTIDNKPLQINTELFSSLMQAVVVSNEYFSSMGIISFDRKLTKIREKVFQGFSSLTSIVIPESVTSIDSSSFEECQGLENITIPESVTSIGPRAFSQCDSLTSITLPKGLTKIGHSAFQFTNLKNITIPEGITSIESGLFWCCDNLTSITIPKDVTSIGYHAFGNCSDLTSITLPQGVTSIGDYAFEFTGLTSITIPKGVTIIGKEVFYSCRSLTSVTLPEGVTQIKHGAFSYCSKIKKIYLPKSLNILGQKEVDYYDTGTFECCESLESVEINGSIAYIGAKTFKGCSRLTGITIPESVTDIYSEAFYNCTNLKEVYCKSITPPYIGNNVFSQSHPDLKIYVPIESVEKYKTDPNWSTYADRIVGYDFTAKQ